MAEVYKINGIDYEAEFKLTNSDGQTVKFTKSAIRGMSLVDDVFNPFIEGNITIANPYDAIEDQYLLRGDGRDELHVSFKPVDKDDSYKIDYTFIVTDDANHVNPDVRSENLKTLALTDKNTLPFTDKIPYGKIYSGKVGDILKDIFKELLGEDMIGDFTPGDFTITYSPPATFRYIDLIFYLMNIYYAKDGDLYVKGFINLDRKTNKYKLELISKIFSDNKKNLMEAFCLGDLTDSLNTSNPNNPPSEAPTGEYIGPMKNLGYSTPLYRISNDFFVNTLVYGYDRILGEHRIIKIKIDDIKNKWKSKFVDVFKSIAGKPKPFLVTNKSTDQKFKKFKLPYNPEDNAHIVEAELHNALTFYNLQCGFSNIGDSSRQSGKFIDIYKANYKGKDSLLKSDEKILGRWYVTQVVHVFYGDTYSNQLLCTKTYVGPDSNIKKADK